MENKSKIIKIWSGGEKSMNVTIATLTTFFILFIKILIIDMFVYQVTFMSALSYMLNTSILTGKIYLLIIAVIALAGAILIDFRQRTTKSGTNITIINN